MPLNRNVPLPIFTRFENESPPLMFPATVMLLEFVSNVAVAPGTIAMLRFADRFTVPAARNVPLPLNVRLTDGLAGTAPKAASALTLNTLESIVVPPL